MIGEAISHYKLLEKLGEGGMGVVYKAEDTKLERPVALKFLPDHLVTSAQDKARFVQEAKSASALNHPNVATVYEIDEADGRLFIAMEFVDGVTLREKLPGISLRQAIEIGIQVADGLAAAHEKGIIHRDVKPENIMVRKDGIAQVMDFGLAKLRGTKSKISRLTKEGSTIGTAGYMSPEQVQGQEVDHRTDIFSLGVVLYELFTGQLPFKGVHETALLYEIVNVDPVPMSAVKPEIDPMLDGIVLECLAKDPAERYQSVAEVAKELRRVKRESTRQRATRTTVAYRTSQSVAGTAGASSAPRSTPAQRFFPFVSAVLLIAVIALSWILWKKATPAVIPVMRFPINLPLTAPLVGGASTVAISPDGKNIVYLALSDGVPKLFLRPLDQFTAQVLPGTDGANDPFFSPDGQWVAFFAAGKLKKVSIFGGAAQDVCDIPGFMRGGWWSPDSLIWFGHINSCIYCVSPAGGKPVEATVLDSARGEISHRFPQPLPGGQWVIFTVKHDNITSFDDAVIAAENVQTHVRKTLITGGSHARYIPTGHIMFARGSSLYAAAFDPEAVEVKSPPVPVVDGGMLNPLSGDANFQVSNTGTLIYVPVGSVTGVDATVAWIDALGRTTPMIDSVRAYADAFISPDGQRISMTIRAANDDIWMYQIARATLTRFTFGGGNSDFPVWTPDGGRILYTSERNRSMRLFWKPWDGSGPAEQVGDADHLDGVSPPAFSPDGKLIAYGREGDIWILRLDSLRTSVRLMATPSFETDPQFSPDGRWLSYTSNESGRNEVYVTPYPSHNAKYQVSSNGGFSARWTRDGKKLIYGEGTKLMETDVNVGEAFDFSQPRKVFDVPHETEFLEMNPDGKKGIVILSKPQDVNATQVDVVVGWFSELRQRFAKGPQ